MLTIITAIKNESEKIIKSRLNFFQIAFEIGINFEWVIQASLFDSNLEAIFKDYSYVSFKSETDISIYDAWNKALLRAKGSKICFLGIDDIPTIEWLLFVEKTQLTKFDAIACKVEMISEMGIPLGTRNNLKVGLYDFGKVIFCHPGIVFSAYLYEEWKFNPHYKIISDSVFYGNFNKIKIVNYFNSVGVQMHVGGISNSRIGARNRFLEFVYAVSNGHLKFNRLKILLWHFPGFLLSYLPNTFFKFFQELRWKLF